MIINPTVTPAIKNAIIIIITTIIITVLPVDPTQHKINN